MIPWDTFKTPLDAYEWAGKNFDRFPKTGEDSRWLTPPQSCNWAWFTIFEPGGDGNRVTLKVRR